MNYLTFDDLLPRMTRGSRPLMMAEWTTLCKPAFIEGIMFAAGSMYKAFETLNFGWVIFHPEAKTADGSTPGRRFFRY